jgi:hypothetical protein
MMWVICTSGYYFLSEDGTTTPWIDKVRVYKDQDEALVEAMRLSKKHKSTHEVISLGDAARIEAKRLRKMRLEEKREGQATCSYLPYPALFRINPDGDCDSFGFTEFRSLYLSVRGSEIVGIIGEVDGQPISISGTDYCLFTEEFSLAPICSDCGKPLDADDDGDDDDDERLFDPADYR